MHYSAGNDNGFIEGVIELILEHNADMLAVGSYGNTPLDDATLVDIMVEDNIVDCLLQLSSRLS